MPAFKNSRIMPSTNVDGWSHNRVPQCEGSSDGGDSILDARGSLKAGI
jgi:hypothetical protein